MLKFKNWLLKEMMGSVAAIVTCKDLNNPNFQIQGALSNLNCKGKKKQKVKTMKFNKPT